MYINFNERDQFRKIKIKNIRVNIADLNPIKSHHKCHKSSNTIPNKNNLRCKFKFKIIRIH